MGIPVLSPEEADQRAISRSVNKTGQTIQAQMDLARRLLPAMKAVDPSITLPMLMQEITGHRLGGIGGANAYATVYGTVNGKPVGALLDKATGHYVDNITHEPMQDFIPSRAGSVQSQKLTGAAGAAVNEELLAQGLAPQLVDPQSPEYHQAVVAASKKLSAAGAVKGDAALAQLHLRQWALGEPQTQPGAAPAASTAAAGAGVAPGAEPSAQAPGTPPQAPTPAAAPAPSSQPPFAQRENEANATPTAKYKGAVYDTLEPVMQAEAERFAFYQQAPPGTRAAVTPRVAKELAAAKEINPDFDQKNYQNIQQGLKAFTTGKQGDNLASLNMTLGHLETFAKKAEQLDNADVKLWNLIANKGLEHTGDPRVEGLLTAREALSNELTRLFRGTGGNEEEVKNWRARLGETNSPQQFAENIRTLDDLITSRQKSLQQQWKTIQGAPEWDKMGFVSQASKDAVARTDVIARRMASGQAPPKKSQTSQPSKAAAPQNKPGKGTDAFPGAQIINGKIVYGAPAGR
jgi:hypothetical protein